MTDTIDVQLLLADAFDTLITTDDLTRLLVDWYAFSPKPEAFIEARIGRQWVGLECDVRSFEASVGRALTLESVEAGVATIHLSNRGGRYTRFLAQAPPLTQNTEIRLRVRHPTIAGGGIEAVVWHGWVIEWEQDWAFGDDAVVVTAADAVSLLSEQGGALGWTVGLLGESVAQRLSGLVTRVGLHNVRCYFERGNTALVNPSVSGSTVLEEAFRTALTDGGRFFSECDRDGFYYVYLDRHRFERPPLTINPIYSAALTNPQFARQFGLPRPGQVVVPLFSDWCVEWDRTGVPYTDLRWRYVGWDVPSVVAVTNASPPQEYDANGDELPLAWDERGAIAVNSNSAHHHIIEYTDLRFTSQAEADRLSLLYATVQGKATLEIEQLEVHPELDARLWDLVDVLRQGDWIKVERHLQTHRFVATAAIEGIAWSLVPDDDGGQPRWTVTYKLSTVNVEVYETPPAIRGPRPAGFPALQPPLPDPLPPITLHGFDDGSTFTERGPIPFLFQLVITDADHPQSHQAFVFHPDFGTIELFLMADGVYTGDTIMRQYGGKVLAPGTWYVWTRDTELVTRASNQLVFSIPEWGAITDVVIADIGNDILTVTYTDHRYPPVPGQSVWFRGREGSQNMPLLDVLEVGTDRWQVSIDTATLPPDTYGVWVQDVDDYRRKSDSVDWEKLPTMPFGIKLANVSFNPPPWEVEQWEDVTVEWQPVPAAERYLIEYYEAIEGEPFGELRNASSKEPFHVFRGGEIRDDIQRQRHYQFRVAATTNGQDSAWTNWYALFTGYRFHITRKDYVQRGSHYLAGKNVTMGLTIPPVNRPYWTQQTNPNEDLFVGIHVRRLRFENLRATGRKANGQLIAHEHLMFTENTDAPQLSDIRQVINGYQAVTIPNNPTTEPPFYGYMSIEQWGPGIVGIRPVGTWWGTAAPNTEPAVDSWISGTVIAEGDIYEYKFALLPSLQNYVP